jgi:phenylacetate-coenzyme A ligase PaaK-like adenylate-forming protein
LVDIKRIQKFVEMKSVKIQGHKVALTSSGSVSKDLLLSTWQQLKPARLKPDPIMYKHKGTTIDQDGLRICGSPEFIAAVMERVKDLLNFESSDTRLGVSFSEITDKETGDRIEGRFRCSIQVHERGPHSVR